MAFWIKGSFWLKVLLAAGLVALADWLFIWHLPGSTVGMFALAWLAVVVVARPGIWRDRRGLLALVAALGFGILLVDRPGLLVWCLFGLALAVAAMSSRVRSGEPVWRWAQRLIITGIVALLRPLLDLIDLSKVKRRCGGLSPLGLAGRLVMPVVGGLIFLGLFAMANPLIGEMLKGLTLGPLRPDWLARVIVWGFVGLMVWGILRPTWRNRLVNLPSRKAGRAAPGLQASIIWSLIVFNAVFALQNALDIAFLWSGAPLPGDVGLADYAHRGTYLLIVTAILAGLFVLIALRPGSETANKPLVRWLVALWIGQTMLLVASCLIRMQSYVAAYALTPTRLAAVAFMVLVGIGLALICWRMLKAKSADWLVDANAMATLAMLAAIAVVDLGAISAAWNVRNAREVGGTGVELDLAYLNAIGAPALVSLVELQQSDIDPAFRDRVAAVRRDVHRRVNRDSREWRGWTWRNQRRLDRVAALARRQPLTEPLPGIRNADGTIYVPPSSPVDVVLPLTPAKGG